jgi:hypothetical protein
MSAQEAEAAPEPVQEPAAAPEPAVAEAASPGPTEAPAPAKVWKLITRLILQLNILPHV